MTINKTLTGEEFEDYRALAEILPETQSKQVIQRLIAKVDSEKQDRIWAEEAEKKLMKENDELKAEIESSSASYIHGYTSPMPYTNTNTGSHMPNYSPVERNIINKLKEDNSKLLANVRTLEEENEKLKAEIESSSARNHCRDRV